MAELKLHETQAISELAGLLYDYLPATAHPFSHGTFTFGDAAERHGLSQFWQGGSKFPALTRLLADTWRFEPGRFERLLITIVQEGIKYRAKKGRPVARHEVQAITDHLMFLGLWVPELADAKFLASLPYDKPAQVQTHAQPATPASREPALVELKARFTELIAADDAQQRGYKLQALLGDLFALEELAPRDSFRVVGEEIDGSLEFQGETYLVEARWRAAQTIASEVYAFHEKVERKSAWTRGLFISMSGFTGEALEAFAKGKASRIIGMDGRDLAVLLDGVYSLTDALRLKLRALSETGAFFKALE